MTLQDFPLLTDENIDPDVVAFLRSAGFNVFDIGSLTILAVNFFG